MTNEVLALALTVLVHIVGMVALVWALLVDDDERPNWRRGFDAGDDDAPEPGPSPRGGGSVPLDVAEPSSVRLREPGRMADGYDRPPRRPAHAPRRVPARTPPVRD